MQVEQIVAWGGTIVAVAAGIAAAAKAIVVMTKSTRDDEIVARIEAGIRKIEELTKVKK